MKPLAVIALGSNLGDSSQILRDVMARLQGFSDSPIIKSSLWQTTPVDCPPGSPKFLNAVAGLIPRKDETPELLLAKLHALEQAFGRGAKKMLNEPRPLDLDLIAFGNETRHSVRLVLPHPRAAERKFVLQPLSEIAPQLILAGQTKTVSELLSALNTDEILARVD